MGTPLAEVLTPSESGSTMRRAGTGPADLSGWPSTRCHQAAASPLPDERQGNCALIARGRSAPQVQAEP